MKSLVFISGLLVMAVGHAKQIPNPYTHCFKQASQKYAVSETLLSAIGCVESRFNPMAISPPNKNGSRDYGLMQINERNLIYLGLNTNTVLNACNNIQSGARILAEKIHAHGSTWEAVGAYNAASSHKRVGYAWKVYSIMQKGVCA